jgi:hypothetical protein
VHLLVGSSGDDVRGQPAAADPVQPGKSLGELGRELKTRPVRDDRPHPLGVVEDELRPRDRVDALGVIADERPLKTTVVEHADIAPRVLRVKS